MCFSAGASFTVGLFLSIVGLLSFRKAPKRYKLFAATPFLFAIQQIAEGFLWARQNSSSADPLRQIMIYAFLFFAFVVWPTWIPLSTHICESKKKLKQICGWLLVFGFIFSCILLAGLVFNGATADITGCHIVYTVPQFIPMPPIWALLIYTCFTIAPFFIISLPGSSFIGGLIALSCIASWFIWSTYFTSVWCFFAAIISIFVLIYLPHKKAL